MSTQNCTGAILPILECKYLNIFDNAVGFVNLEAAPNSLSFTELHRCNSALEISK